MVRTTRRINRGNGHSYVLDGESCLGVTSILSAGVPKKAFIETAAKDTAAYAVNNWADLDQLEVADRLRAIEEGRFERLRTAGIRGTRVHEYAARITAGESVDVPDEYDDLVRQAVRFLDEWNVREVAVEATVINRRWRYMGCCDLLAYVGTNGDGAPWLLDWKTAASGVWPETALQLCAYAWCGTMLDDAGDEVPMPQVAHAAAVWLRADGYDVIPCDISRDAFATFLDVMRVAAFVGQPREAYVGDALEAPARLEVAQ